jgi:dipeptidase D
MDASPFARLEPRAVWEHFATLCAIPRPSRHEAALRDHLLAWAGARGIAARVDDIGNLILRKPASPGRESCPGVVLQGHLDMVCQKNAGTVHDFHRDPIRPVLKDGWLAAEDTTLGADNGIGVALALAALDEPGLVHPPLEVLLTVDEEAGMGGARALAPGTLVGGRLINLDTEEWGEFYLGCAGGMDVEVGRACGREPLPPGFTPWRLAVTGLQGGHSGIDIHFNRGNAIRLLVECLRALALELDARLIALEGGTARNAIPREAFGVFALPPAAAGRLPALLDALLQAWKRRLAGIDDGVRLSWERAIPMDTPPGDQALLPVDQAALLDFLHAAPNGMARMSADFPGVVETSDNLGVASLCGETGRAVFMVRSLKDADAHALADKLIRYAAAHGFQAGKVGPYPGWTPNPASALLALGRRVYQREFGRPAGLQVIHAGLECGLLAASHPGLDMISFGPDIRGAHAPGERVEIHSVARCWVLLKAMLEELARC